MRFLIFSLIFIFSTSAFAGGPWAEEPGKGYVEASALFALGTTVKDNTYQVYGEIGVFDKLTLKLVLPFKYVESPSDLDPNRFRRGEMYGFSNIVLGAKYQILKKKAVLSAGFDVEFKTFNSNDIIGLRTGFEKYTFRPNVSLGFGIDKLYTYGEIRPGFSTNGYGHDMSIVAEIGGKAYERVWVAGYFEYRGTFKNGDFNDTQLSTYSATGFFQDEQNFVTMGAKLSVQVYKGFGLNGAAFYALGLTSSSVPGGNGNVALKIGAYYDW